MAKTVTQAAALAYLEAECARQSLHDYAPLVSPDGYEQPAQVVALIEKLEALERRDITRLIVEMPPRSSKSTHVSRLYPSWWLGRHPDDNVILASYGQELATGHGRAVRDLLGHPRYPFTTKLRADVKAAGRWQTDAGGGLIAAGVGTGLTGFGGHLLVLDDPIKGREEAESEIVRDHTWDWYQEVFGTRIQRDGVVVVLGTRWHEDDPIGRILNTAGAEDWTRLRIPYLAEPDDALGRAEGEALDVFGTVPSVEKGEISAYGFSALYQQRPTPAGGGVFKSEWMTRRYTSDSLTETIRTSARFTIVMSIDTGGKPGVGHDPSAISVWGTDGLSYFLLDSWADTVEYADVKQKIVDLWWEWRPRMAFIEDQTHAAPIISDMRRGTGVNIAAVRPSGSKWVRADAISPLFQAGRVVLPTHASWLDAWMHEHLSFPNGTHDDRVDATSLVLSEMVKMVGGATMSTRTDVRARDERPAERVMRELRAKAGRPAERERKRLGGVNG